MTNPADTRPDAPAPPAPASRLTGFFAVLAAAGLTLAAVCAAGWYLSANRPVTAADLTPDERQAIVSEALTISPTDTHEPALAAPRIQFTLRRDATIEAWDDRFVSNELGYRSGPAAKPAATFRLLFVGDSWTYGMGVLGDETFAQVTAELIRRSVDLSPRFEAVEAWVLALPGYNTFHQTSALSEYLELLEPDAVIICPTINDADSGYLVLPTGSLTRAGLTHDAWGSPFPVLFHHRLVASHRYRERWRTALAQIRALERRLSDRGVPLLLFFTGSWYDEVPAGWVAEAEIDAPFLVTPRRLTGPAWRNPQPIGHPNPAAHALYARMVYKGLAELFDWPPLPPGNGEQPAADAVEVRRRDGSPQAAAAAQRRLLAETEALPERYLPAAAPRFQCVTRMDCAGGDFGRHAAILIRRTAATERVSVAVRRLPQLSWSYPLELTVEIPAPGGGTRAAATIPAGGEPIHRIVLPIPPGIAPGEALDVILTADRTGAVVTPDGVISRSLRVVAIEQVEG